MQPFIVPALATEPKVLARGAMEPGEGRTLLLVVAHGDDPAMFLGGVLRLWAELGWHIHCLRVTDDRWDSFGLDEAETVQRNTREFEAAAEVLGIAATESLGWQTDVLGDASRVALREAVVRCIRKVRPYGVVTFDPNSAFHEDNLDHRVLAEAVDEAFWTAQFDKHHPEHFDDGLLPHGTYERWYFGRTLLSVTHVFDTSAVLERQLEAILCHKTMLTNIVRQFALQSATAGTRDPLLEAAEKGAHAPLFSSILRRSAAAKGKPFGLAAAEVLRLSRADLAFSRTA